MRTNRLFWCAAAGLFTCALAGAAEPSKLPSKPSLTSLEPRGLQRGVETKIKLTGTGLDQLTNVTFQTAQLRGQFLPEARSNEVWIKVTATADLARGAYEVSVKNTAGESGKLKLHVDDLPQVHERQTTNAPTRLATTTLPVSFWGTLEKAGGVDQFEFPAKAGESLVFDLAADSLGSKAKNTVLTLTDARGAVLASNNGFDGGADPLLAYTFPTAGIYRIRVSDAMAAASKEHFYRLSIGAFPYVTGHFPLSVPAQTETAVELAGYNLPAGTRVRLKTGAAGEMTVPVDANLFRSRKVFKALVSDGTELVETEPNDLPESATPIRVPGAVNGRIWPRSLTGRKGATPAPPADVDLFRFDAHAGQTWIIETMAARRDSPIDTKIEILHLDGTPVQRLLLQATRDSYITFRGIDSNIADARLQNWEEMELNQFAYLQGEICKLFRAPQGPDSGFNFYTMAGKRRAYFDTSATAHANDEPCYIVEPHPPGTRLVANGLPVFTLNYANDDDGERKLGADSKLQFTAPKDGAYLIRVTDTRGFGGDRFAYRLVVRDVRPDFQVTLNGANPEVNAGSGKNFSVSAERIDGYDGEIAVEISGLPPGFSASTPLVIQAGHDSANATLNAAADAPQPTEANWSHTKVSAQAMVKGQKVTKDVNNLGRIKLADKPKLFVALEPEPGTIPAAPAAGQPLEITIAPGQMIPARLKVRRNGHDDLITFTVDNLPHGVIVDNIGLNGVLIPKGENERQIFLSAARWVPETDRLCYAVENQVGRQTSLPVLIKVRKPASLAP